MQPLRKVFAAFRRLNISSDIEYWYQQNMREIRIWDNITVNNTGLFISPSGISKIDFATTKTDTAERSISMDRESLQVFVKTYSCSICATLVTRQTSIL